MATIIKGMRPWLQDYLLCQLRPLAPKPSLNGCHAQVVDVSSDGRTLVLWDGSHCMNAFLSNDAVRELRDKNAGAPCQSLLGRLIAPVSAVLFPQTDSAPPQALLILRNIRVFPDSLRHRPAQPLQDVHTLEPVVSALRALVARTLADCVPPSSSNTRLSPAQKKTGLTEGLDDPMFPPKFLRIEEVPFPASPGSAASTPAQRPRRRPTPESQRRTPFRAKSSTENAQPLPSVESDLRASAAAPPERQDGGLSAIQTPLDAVPGHVSGATEQHAVSEAREELKHEENQRLVRGPASQVGALVDDDQDTETIDSSPENIEQLRIISLSSFQSDYTPSPKRTPKEPESPSIGQKTLRRATEEHEGKNNPGGGCEVPELGASKPIASPNGDYIETVLEYGNSGTVFEPSIRKDGPGDELCYEKEMKGRCVSPSSGPKEQHTFKSKPSDTASRNPQTEYKFGESSGQYIQERSSQDPSPNTGPKIVCALPVENLTAGTPGRVSSDPATKYSPSEKRLRTAQLLPMTQHFDESDDELHKSARTPNGSSETEASPRQILNTKGSSTDCPDSIAAFVTGKKGQDASHPKGAKSSVVNISVERAAESEGPTENSQLDGRVYKRKATSPLPPREKRDRASKSSAIAILTSMPKRIRSDLHGDSAAQSPPEGHAVISNPSLENRFPDAILPSSEKTENLRETQRKDVRQQATVARRRRGRLGSPSTSSKAVRTSPRKAHNSLSPVSADRGPHATHLSEITLKSPPQSHCNETRQGRSQSRKTMTRVRSRTGKSVDDIRKSKANGGKSGDESPVVTDEMQLTKSTSGEHQRIVEIDRDSPTALATQKLFLREVDFKIDVDAWMSFAYAGGAKIARVDEKEQEGFILCGKSEDVYNKALETSVYSNEPVEKELVRTNVGEVTVVAPANSVPEHHQTCFTEVPESAPF